MGRFEEAITFVRWIKIFIYIIILYVGFNRQPFYLSSFKQTNPNLIEIRRVQAFLQKYDSPLQANAKDFVQASQKYHIPYKVIVSISGVESGFGKHNPSCAKYNPFGYSSTTSPCGWWRFSSYKESIWIVAKTIGTSNYYADFRRTGQVEELAKNYNLGSEKWSQDVKYFMNQL
jgi:Mannosyl-glycoprotein endo-beta-N-acetylglucosaminidase